MRSIAQIFSLLLHPFLMPVYLLFLIFHIDSVFLLVPQLVKAYCYLIIIFMLVIIPLLSFPLLKRYRLISNYKLDIKQERVYPILIVVICAFLSFWLIGKFSYTNIIQQLLLTSIIVLSGFALITIRWKMSMHMTAIGAACGFITILDIKYVEDIRSIFILTVLLSGILASCRLYLGKQDQAQIYAGFLFGFLFVMGILF